MYQPIMYSLSLPQLGPAGLMETGSGSLKSEQVFLKPEKQGQTEPKAWKACKEDT